MTILTPFARLFSDYLGKTNSDNSVGWAWVHSQGRIKASAGPGAVPNAGPLQTYYQVTTTTNCGPPKLRARVLQHP